MKTCRTCQVPKLPEDFYVRSHRHRLKSGELKIYTRTDIDCKKCHNRKSLEYAKFKQFKKVHKEFAVN